MDGVSVGEMIRARPHLFASSSVLGGTGGLGRLITNVNVMEVPDVYNWVRPGDLLLTTAFSIKDNEQAQLQLIPRLKEARIAAIAIKTKRYMEQVPARMIEMADACELPIVELADNVSYSQMLQEMMDEIMRYKARLLADIQEGIQQITNTMVMGENLQVFVETVAGCLGHPVAFAALTGETVASHSSRPVPWPDSLPKNGEWPEEHRVDGNPMLIGREENGTLTVIVPVERGEGMPAI
ncbi:PucR family transcriptional regulator ligand-binding domain-containing protein [Paenibacillus sp. CC-CFT747]|nr:PucR family transcriptional regulator ligand-binding domain-containing protein [Paenibacillus sp. CC-CFT747]